MFTLHSLVSLPPPKLPRNPSPEGSSRVPSPAGPSTRIATLLKVGVIPGDPLNRPEVSERRHPWWPSPLRLGSPLKDQPCVAPSSPIWIPHGGTIPGGPSIRGDSIPEGHPRWPSNHKKTKRIQPHVELSGRTVRPPRTQPCWILPVSPIHPEDHSLWSSNRLWGPPDEGANPDGTLLRLTL